MVAISCGIVFLAILFSSITGKGLTAFQQTEIRLEVFFDEQAIDPQGSRDAAILGRADYQGLIKESLRRAFPGVKARRDKKELYRLASIGAGYQLRRMVMENPGLVGKSVTVWVLASDDVDMIAKGVIPVDARPEVRRLSDRQMEWVGTLRQSGRLETRFNTTLFTAGDSREPELAGVAAAAAGSLMAILVCLALSFPFGVMTAVYLEEFAPKNLWIGFVEVNINNLAAVPSIVFGLLGMAVFLNFFGLPRSAPLVGGLVLALMTLPTIIIAGRVALGAVPPSIREAALAVGASPVQAVFHHVLPLAMPGILTGAIIGMARALGETAPLIMIGMIAFVVDIPGNFTDPATALPAQIYLWADSPERAFESRTAAAIIILLVFLVFMNLLAIVLRRKFETRW